jgi:hypothetical protein
MSRICARNWRLRWRETGVVAHAAGTASHHSGRMRVKFHLDRPASILLDNLCQEFTGWLALPQPGDLSTLRFALDGELIQVQFLERPEVQQRHPDSLVVSWSFRLDHRVMFGQPRRTLQLEVWHGGECVYSRHFYKSKDLMPAERNSPLFFMHIPKTAGTALRQFTDYAFASLPSMLLYGDFPGFPLANFGDEHWRLAKTRELIFGHYDFDFVRTLNEINPKIVTIFRNPLDLIHSYLRFEANPAPEFLDNPLVRHVCGLSYTAPFGLISEQHLQEALRLADRHFFVVQQENLQAFADSVTTAFALPDFEVPQINRNPDMQAAMPTTLPFDVSFDLQLYQACRYPTCDFLHFLNA